MSTLKELHAAALAYRDATEYGEVHAAREALLGIAETLDDSQAINDRADVEAAAVAATGFADALRELDRHGLAGECDALAARLRASMEVGT